MTNNWREERDWIISTAGCPGYRRRCHSCSQVGVLGSTNSKQDPAHEQHKPQKSRSKWEKLWQALGERIDEQEAFSTTQGHLSLCHWRDAVSPAWLPQYSWRRSRNSDLVFWCFHSDLWPAWGQPSFRQGHWPSALHPTREARRNHTDLVQSPEITPTALSQALKEKQEKCWSGFGSTLFSLLTYTK